MVGYPRLRSVRWLRLLSRLLRQIALASLLCTFVWQAWTSWRKFMQGGTINLAKRLHPKVQPFPDATVCIQYHHQGNASSDANNTHHLETDWLWAYAIPNSYGLHDIKFLFNSSSKLSSEPWSRSPSSELVLRVWTESAYCYKFRFMEQLGSGLFNRVELYFKAMTNGDYVSVNLHHPDWDVPGGFFGSEANVSPKLERNLRKPLFDMYSIETKKVTRLSTKEAPCIDGKDYKKNKKYRGTMMECLVQTFMDKRGCRMPWQESGGEVCDHVEFEAFLQALRSTPTLEKFVEMTGCVHSCETTTYIAQSTQDGVNEWTDLDFSLVLGFYLTSVTEEREVLAFDGLDLVGNVGGYLGLLLGFSAMSVCGFILRKVEEGGTGQQNVSEKA